jgi:hypothetical protein
MPERWLGISSVKKEGGPVFPFGITGPRVFFSLQHDEAAEAVGGDSFSPSTAVSGDKDCERRAIPRFVSF